MSAKTPPILKINDSNLKAQTHKFYLGIEELTIDIDKLGKLTIELANPTCLLVRRKVITKEEEIMIITANVLTSTLELFNAICEAFSPSFPSGTISFDEENSCLLIKNNIFLSKKNVWQITLEKVDNTPDDKFEFLTHRLDVLQWVTLHPLWAQVEKPNFEISRDGKAVTKKAGTGNNAWQGFLSEKPYPPEGKFKITIELFHLGNSKNIMIGVAKKSIDTTNGCYTKSGLAWMLHLADGTFYFNGNGSGQAFSYLTINRVWFDKGDELTILFDTKSRLLAFELNTFSLGTAYRLPAFPEELHLAIDLLEPEQKVSFK
jgi:hypothetical protein